MKHKRTIEELNANTSLEDVKVLWMGNSVMLVGKDQRGELTDILKTLKATPNVVERITRWCDAFDYRCTMIRDGRVWL